MSFLKEIAKPDGRIFAIGDIHGCVSETEVLLNWLERNEGLSQKDRVIFIGDYIDRGPNSKAVIDLLLQFQKKYSHTIFLKGNHEDMLLDYIGIGGTNKDVYLENGGAPTLGSYGLPEEASVEDILSRIPETHLNFLKNLDSFIGCGDYFFVHAGLNVQRTISKQNTDDIYWIREKFLGETHSFGRVIVFGHTPHAEILYNLPYKLGIDTGLVYGNMLSCVELTQQLVYQVLSQGREVQVSDFPE